MRIVLLVLVLLPAWGCAPKIVCDQKVLSETTLEGLEKMPVEKRSDFTLKMLGTVCTEPASLAKTYSSWDITPPDQRMRLIAKSIDENGRLWKTACPGGASVLEKAAQLDVDARRKLFFDECDLARYGLPEEAWHGENGPAAILYMPVIEGSGVSAEVQTALRQGLLAK